MGVELMRPIGARLESEHLQSTNKIKYRKTFHMQEASLEHVLNCVGFTRKADGNNVVSQI
jgi:hypothetical protein